MAESIRIGAEGRFLVVRRGFVDFAEVQAVPRSRIGSCMDGWLRVDKFDVEALLFGPIPCTVAMMNKVVAVRVRTLGLMTGARSRQDGEKNMGR